MTCRATYANRPRTREDERKTAKIVVQLPYAEIARAAYHRGLEKRDQLLAQAPQRVRWTVTVIASRRLDVRCGYRATGWGGDRTLGAVLSAPVFTASEGRVFRRGIFVPEPSRQLAAFLDSAEAGDWFAPRAAELATELQDAITIAEAYHNHIPEGIAA